MEFSYGKGWFVEGTKRIDGIIILSEHRLFLKGPEGDIAATYVPLEKIEKILRKNGDLQVHVRPSLAYRYVVKFSGEKKHILDLTKDIVTRRQLKKRLLKNEWYEETH